MRDLQVRLLRYFFWFILDTIKHNDKEWDIIALDRPVDCPYVLLQILSKDKNQSRGIHILSLGEKAYVKMGRGQDNDLRITDISVSRCHSVLKYCQGKFLLEDNESKFGTLVLLQKPLLIHSNMHNMALQVGRSLFYFNVKSKMRSFSLQSKSKYSVFRNNRT